MTQISRITVLVILALASSRVASAEDRKCVFSIEVIRDGAGARRAGDTAVGDGIFIYEYAGGWLVAERHEAWHGLGTPQPANDERWGSGKEFTARIREIFGKAHLREIDFTRALAQKDLMKGSFAVIGARLVKVDADLEGTTFSLTCEALGAKLAYYSTSDPDLAKLKTLLDQIAFEYGRAKILNL